MFTLDRSIYGIPLSLAAKSMQFNRNSNQFALVKIFWELKPKIIFFHLSTNIQIDQKAYFYI